MKTKLIFFLPGLHGGGAERVAVNILRKLDSQKHEIHLVLTEKKGRYLELIPEHVAVHDLKVSKTMFSILKLRKFVLLLNPDIIFSTLFRTHIAIDLALVGLTNKPKIVYRSPNSPKLLLENNQLSLIMKTLLRRAYKNADTIIAQTPEMKDEIIKYHKIKKDKIIVMLNPVDTEHIDKSVKNIRNPFDNTHINVVAAGRLTEQKGFDILIKSFSVVVKKDSLFKLYIIGEGSIGELSKLMKLVKKYNLEKYVEFLGFQENPYQYFYYSSLYVLSSRWEGLPNTVLENLYLKKPIVATNCIPIMSDLIKTGVNGILVDVENVDQLSDAILDYKTISMKSTLPIRKYHTFKQIIKGHDP
jgi:glycosyltransferase involved in cell wall biosynthesis